MKILTAGRVYREHSKLWGKVSRKNIKKRIFHAIKYLMYFLFFCCLLRRKIRKKENQFFSTIALDPYTIDMIANTNRFSMCRLSLLGQIICIYSYVWPQRVFSLSLFLRKNAKRTFQLVGTKMRLIFKRWKKVKSFRAWIKNLIMRICIRKKNPFFFLHLSVFVVFCLLKNIIIIIVLRRKDKKFSFSFSLFAR